MSTNSFFRGVLSWVVFLHRAVTARTADLLLISEMAGIRDLRTSICQQHCGGQYMSAGPSGARCVRNNRKITAWLQPIEGLQWARRTRLSSALTQHLVLSSQ